MACIPQNQYNPSLHEIISTHNTEAECNDNCGVCCLPNGSCVDNTQTECSAAGGSWNAGVTCADVICPSPSPSPSPPPPSPSPSSPPPSIQCEGNEDCVYCEDGGTATDCSECPEGYTCDPGDPELGIAAGCEKLYQVPAGTTNCEDQLGSPPWAGWTLKGGYCCGGLCYPYQVLCTVMGPGTPTEACKEYIQGAYSGGIGGSAEDCCSDLSYSVIGATFDLSGEVLLSVNCAAPYPDCSEDEQTPIYSNPVPDGYSVVNCQPS